MGIKMPGNVIFTTWFIAIFLLCFYFRTDCGQKYFFFFASVSSVWIFYYQLNFFFLLTKKDVSVVKKLYEIKNSLHSLALWYSRRRILRTQEDTYNVFVKLKVWKRDYNFKKEILNNSPLFFYIKKLCYFFCFNKTLL